MPRQRHLTKLLSKEYEEQRNHRRGTLAPQNAFFGGSIQYDSNAYPRRDFRATENDRPCSRERAQDAEFTGLSPAAMGQTQEDRDIAEARYWAEEEMEFRRMLGLARAEREGPVTRPPARPTRSDTNASTRTGPPPYREFALDEEEAPPSYDEASHHRDHEDDRREGRASRRASPSEHRDSDWENYRAGARIRKEDTYGRRY